jgi:hypothetical protein
MAALGSRFLLSYDYCCRDLLDEEETSGGATG